MFERQNVIVENLKKNLDSAERKNEVLIRSLCFYIMFYGRDLLMEYEILLFLNSSSVILSVKSF
jgi:hypothetical protein